MSQCEKDNIGWIQEKLTFTSVLTNPPRTGTCHFTLLSKFGILFTLFKSICAYIISYHSSEESMGWTSEGSFVLVGILKFSVKITLIWSFLLHCLCDIKCSVQNWQWPLTVKYFHKPLPILVPAYDITQTTAISYRHHLNCWRSFVIDSFAKLVLTDLHWWFILLFIVSLHFLLAANHFFLGPFFGGLQWKP